MLPGWSDIELSGHPCDVFEPQSPIAHNYAIVYLHGVHLTRLVDQPTFTELFERHGLPVIAPMTARSWWTDKICPEFDPQLTAERHVLDNVVPYVRERWSAECTAELERLQETAKHMEKRNVSAPASMRRWCKSAPTITRTSTPKASARSSISSPPARNRSPARR